MQINRRKVRRSMRWHLEDSVRVYGGEAIGVQLTDMDEPDRGIDLVLTLEQAQYLAGRLNSFRELMEARLDDVLGVQP